jgi:hypothetical protein
VTPPFLLSLPLRRSRALLPLSAMLGARAPVFVPRCAADAPTATLGTGGGGLASSAIGVSQRPTEPSVVLFCRITCSDVLIWPPTLLLPPVFPQQVVVRSLRQQLGPLNGSGCSVHFAVLTNYFFLHYSSNESLTAPSCLAAHVPPSCLVPSAVDGELAASAIGASQRQRVQRALCCFDQLLISPLQYSSDEALTAPSCLAAYVPPSCLVPSAVGGELAASAIGASQRQRVQRALCCFDQPLISPLQSHPTKQLQRRVVWPPTFPRPVLFPPQSVESSLCQQLASLNGSGCSVHSRAWETFGSPNQVRDTILCAPPVTKRYSEQAPPSERAAAELLAVSCLCFGAKHWCH